MTQVAKLSIHNVKQAAWIIERILINNGVQTVKHPTHKNPNGLHVYLKSLEYDITYHIKFAREPFMTFGYMFRQYAGQIGETLDKEILDDLKDTDVLFFAYPDKIYYCSVSTFREFAMQRVNDADNGKATLSIPMTKLMRFCP